MSRFIASPRRLVVPLVSWLLVASVAEAEPVLTFVGGVIAVPNEASTRGWSFDVVDPRGIRLTHLAMFDYRANGLVEPHEVGVWDAEGRLLAAATVPAGVAAPLDETGLFRIVAVPDVVLRPGTGYVIGAFFPEDGFDPPVYRVSNLWVTPLIQYTGGRIGGGPALAYPNVPLDSFFPDYRPSFFGPSFHAVVVPEPSALLLAAAGFGAALGTRWWRRRKQRRRWPPGGLSQG